MGIRSKEIGHSAEYYLLYDILKQLERLTQVMGTLTTSSTTTTP